MAKENDKKNDEPGSNNAQEDEECVICLEQLTSQPWGRCTPCRHAFHQECWQKWEDAHAQRLQDRQSSSGINLSSDEGARCCLCNAVNQKFVDKDDVPVRSRSESEGTRRPGLFDWFQRRRTQPGANDRNSQGSANSRFNQFFERVSQQGATVASDARHFFEQFEDIFQEFNDPSARNSYQNQSSNTRGQGYGGTPFSSRQAQSQRTGSSSTSANNDSPNSHGLLRPGAAVAIQNLINSPRFNGRRGLVRGFNSQMGRYIVILESESPDRHYDHVNSNSASLAAKPVNLLQVISVTIRGIQSEPQLNGLTGTICSYSTAQNRYVVRISHRPDPPADFDSSTAHSGASARFNSAHPQNQQYHAGSGTRTREISLKPANVHIPDGTVVRLEGLERRPQLNGKWGTIVKWVHDNETNRHGSINIREGSLGTGRYEVRLSSTTLVRVKRGNVRL